MSFLLVICIFSSFISGIIVLIDVFKQKQGALGCLGFIGFPIIPMIWVVTGYSGNKKIAASFLYGSLAIILAIAIPVSIENNKTISPFLEGAKEEGISFIDRGWSMTGGKTIFRLQSYQVFEPTEEYKNVDEMVDLIYDEYVNNLLKLFVPPLSEDNEIIMALKTESGFHAVYEIIYPGELRRSYTSDSSPFDD